jgi:exopolyphosphatase/guanosine-5'-triphosphate,3'-diphosphate pyrophosphatase
MTRVAAFDCGTNTIKLLVADLDRATGQAHELVREMRMVRLGQDVDRTGMLAEAALARVFAAVEEYAAIVARHDVEVMRFCATSAARDAGNAAVFMAGISSRLGVEPEVVSGAEEARLSFDGATRGLSRLPAPYLVIDIGGGSTELVLGDEDGHVHAGHSLDVGSVRMTERHLRSDPPTADEVAEAATWIDAALDSLTSYGVAMEEARTAVGVAGTITTVTAMVLDLPAYERSRIDGARVAVADVHDATGRLLDMTVEERRAMPFLHPGRADVIGAGALILDRVLMRAAPFLVPATPSGGAAAGVSGPSMLVRESDILDGIAWSVA